MLNFSSPFKDSPITWLKNDSNIDALKGSQNLTARKYREATLGELVTDLSVDLTVLPLNEANKTEYGKILKKNFLKKFVRKLFNKYQSN